MDRLVQFLIAVAFFVGAAAVYDLTDYYVVGTLLTIFGWEVAHSD